MATMIPPSPPLFASPSEHAVFSSLVEAPLDWVVLHSVKVPQPRSERPREIDFVVLVGQVVICLEIKGGHYEVQGGEWFTRSGNRLGDPVEQARSAMFALKNHLGHSVVEERFSIDVRFEYGVVFTDAEWPPGVRKPKGCLLIDYRTFRDTERFHGELSKHARRVLTKGMKRRLANPVHRALLDSQMDRLREFISPQDFKMRYVRVDRGVLGKIDAELLRLTEEQYRVLRLSEHNDRVMIDGPAGTGKTVLAMELARRVHASGRKVALLCHSPNMKAWLRRQSILEDIAVELCGASVWPSVLCDVLLYDDPVSCGRYNMRYRNLFQRSMDGPEMRALVDEIVDQYALTGRPPPFDYLVVDEAQLMGSECDFKQMDVLLKGGLVDGSWTMLGDFANQDISLGSGDRDFRQELDRLYPHARANDGLLINCRNAQPIAEAIAEFAVGNPYEQNPVFQVPGPEVRRIYYGENAEAGEALNREVEQLLKQRIRPSHIVVVGLMPLEAFTARGFLEGDRQFGGLRLIDVTLDYSSKSNSHLNFSQYIGFQGLESDVVIILSGEPDDMSERFRRALYISMSRARGYLVLIAHEDDRARFESSIDRPIPENGP